MGIKVLSQPRAVIGLTLIESINTFVYFGLMVSLVLYLHNHLHLSISKSYLYYGTYLALLFSWPIGAGYLSDRFFGAQNTILYGLILLGLGSAVIALSDSQHYSLGLSCIICGIGLIKPTTPGLIGQFYQQDDHGSNKERGFTLFYAGMNVGAILGPICFGLFSRGNLWPFSFLCCSAACLIGIGIFLKHRQDFAPLDAHCLYQRVDRFKWIFHVTALMLFFSIVYVIQLLLDHHELYQLVLTNMIGLTVIGILWLLYKEGKSERHRLLALIVFNLLTMCFFIGELQMGGSLSIFISQHINREIQQWQVPTQWLTALLPIFVALGVWTLKPFYQMVKNRYLFDRLWLRMILGLALSILSFITFFILAKITLHTNFGMLGVVLGYFLMGTGEILVGPTLNIATTHLAPKRLQSTFMGIYYLFIAFSGYFATHITRAAAETLNENTYFDEVFGITIVLTIVTLGCTIALYKPIKRLANS